MLTASSFVLFALLAPMAEPLAVAEPTLYQYEGGSPLADNFEFRRGETVFFTTRIKGYTASKDAKIDLAYKIEALDGQGIPIYESAENTVKTDLAPQDKNWTPLLRYTFEIPPLADAGTYRVVVRVHDRIANREATAEIPFRVRAPYVEPSNTLVARNFRFTRTEEGTEIVNPPVYKRGDILWARFDITGYKIGAQNRIGVEYGLSVLTSSGKELYSQPQAAVREASPFYPHRYMPGVLSLNLEKTNPGNYTIVLTLRDLVGGQSAESQHMFKVE